jgi:hypothetical protein
MGRLLASRAQLGWKGRAENEQSADASPAKMKQAGKPYRPIVLQAIAERLAILAGPAQAAAA